jgi:glycine cleavage system H protein
VAGEVLGSNISLTEDPYRSALVNQDPYGEGWLVRIRMSNPDEVKDLLDAEGYKRFLEEAAD